MQIKTTMRWHLTPVRIAIINKSTNCWLGCREKVTLMHCWRECRWVQPLGKTVWSLLQKIKNRTALWPSGIMTLFHFWKYIRRNWNTGLKEYMHPYVHWVMINKAGTLQSVEQPLKHNSKRYVKGINSREKVIVKTTWINTPQKSRNGNLIKKYRWQS